MYNNCLSACLTRCRRAICFKGLTRTIPNEDFIYIGDNANNPVGNRSDDEITLFSFVILQRLLKTARKIDGYCL